jgi:hypothetical protein
VLILLELFRDDRAIIQKILDSIFSEAKNIEYNVMDMLIQRPDMFLHFLEEFNMDLNIFSRNYDNVHDRIDFNPLIEMFNTYSLEQSKRLLDIIKLDEEYRHDLVEMAVRGESQRLFDLIMEDHSICRDPQCRNDFSSYIEEHTDFTTANLDNILSLPNIKIYIDTFGTVINMYMDHNELYRSTRIMDKILSHFSFDPNDIIFFKENDVTILYYIIHELLQHEPRIQSE